MKFARRVRLGILALLMGGITAATAAAQESAQMVVTATVRPSCTFLVPQSQSTGAPPDARVTCGRQRMRSLRVSTESAGRRIALPLVNGAVGRAFTEARVVLPVADARVATTQFTSLPSPAPKPITVTFEF